MSEYFRKQIKRYSQDIINIVGGGDSDALTLTDGLTSTVFTQNDNLLIAITDDKSVIFAQTTQDGSINFNFGNDYAFIGVNSTLNFIEIQSDVNASAFQMFNDSNDSIIELKVLGDDTDTHIELTQATATIFRADGTGISTEGTNYWQLGAASAGAPTADSKIRVTINGTDYDIAAEAV